MLVVAIIAAAAAAAVDVAAEAAVAAAAAVVVVNPKQVQLVLLAEPHCKLMILVLECETKRKQR